MSLDRRQTRSGRVKVNNHGSANLRRTPIGSGDMYERSKEAMARNAAKLDELRSKMMEEYTFTPSTGRSSAASTSRTGSSAEDSVFARLYRISNSSASTSPMADQPPIRMKKSSLSSPGSRASRNSRQSNASRQSKGSTVGSSTSRLSSRIDALYQDGVRRNRSRPTTDREERERREQMQIERELEKCTFQPKLNRVRKLKHVTARVDTGRIGIHPREALSPPRPQIPPLPAGKTRGVLRSPPREILITPTAIFGASRRNLRPLWKSPPRPIRTTARALRAFDETSSAALRDYTMNSYWFDGGDC